jgi:hypothetical protein
MSGASPGIHTAMYERRCPTTGQVTHLFLLPECEQANAGDLDDLKAHAGNITLRLSAATEAGDEHLIVLIDEVQAAIVLWAQHQKKKARSGQADARTHGDEGGDFLAVLDELHAHALADGGVGLLGLNADLLEHDALGVRRTTSRRGLVEVAEGTLLVRLVGLCIVARA